VRRFKFIDHTGDMGVIVYGRSVSELFSHAAEAVFEIITTPSKILEAESRRISLEAGGLEALLVAWLNEFLYLFDTQQLLFRRFHIGHVDRQGLEATAWGEVYDVTRHPIKTAIKAVTFHRLRIQEQRGVWKTQIIFDL
jgi:SHS2 domain-containing protein